MPLVVALFASRLNRVMSRNQCYLSLKIDEYESFIVGRHGFFRKEGRKIQVLEEKRNDLTRTNHTRSSVSNSRTSLGSSFGRSCDWYIGSRQRSGLTSPSAGGRVHQTCSTAVCKRNPIGWTRFKRSLSGIYPCDWLSVAQLQCLWRRQSLPYFCWAW